MKSKINNCLFFMLVLIATQVFLPVQGKSADITAKKTLDRWVDPVIMEGSLASKMSGTSISNLRLYSFHNNTFGPIRFQIDEMTKEGDCIFPDGPIPNQELSNGIFDPWDKLIFMADDTGDRVSKEAWTSGYTKGCEIEVTDPLTGEKGWCYLLYFASDPPPFSTLPDYVRYSYEDETFESDYGGASYVITKNGEHTANCKKHWNTEKAGGNGKPYLDRIKARAEVKMMFGSLTIRKNEEQTNSDVLAYKLGPVRLMKRMEHYSRLPGGLKAMRLVTDGLYYRNVCSTPIILDIPFEPRLVFTEASINYGIDCSPDAIGSMIYNSENPQGFLVDGKMDETEKNFNTTFADWILITGECGTFMNRFIFPKKFMEYGKHSMKLVDDSSQQDPPETYPGIIGCIWQKWEMTNLKKGEYYLYAEFYNIPFYKLGKEKEYLNFRDHPLQIRLEGQQGVSQSMLVPKLGKRYKSIMPRKKK